MVLLPSKQLDMGMPCPDFNLKGIDGEMWSLDKLEDKKALVLIVMCVHCPYVQKIEDKIIEVQSRFEDQGVRVIGINPNDAEKYPEDSFEGMQERAEEMGYNFLYLRDEDQSVARALDAQCTPDIYVFDENRELYYHGKIEGVPEALERMFDGEEPTDAADQEPSQGCSVKWK